MIHTTASAVQEPPAGQDRLVTVTDDRGRTPALSARVLRRMTCTGARHVSHDADGEIRDVRDERRYGHGRFTFAPPDGEPVPAAQPLPGVVCPEAVFPEWPEEIPDDVEPWQVWSRSPLTPTGIDPRPDYNECVVVLQCELERLRPPAPDDVIIAA